MNERSEKVINIAFDALPLAGFAAAGACFAFAAGGHEVYAEQAKTIAIRHHEEHFRNANIVPAVIFEGLVAAQGINIARRKTRT